MNAKNVIDAEDIMMKINSYMLAIKYQRPRDATADYELCPSCCQMLQRFLEFKAMQLLSVMIMCCIYDLLLTFRAMWLWNWIMPYLFGIPCITYWMMFGLLVLLMILIPQRINGWDDK